MERSDATTLEVGEGEGEALATLFAENRDRLKALVKPRIDARLSGRLDESDVVQETYLDARRRWKTYREAPDLPPRVWLRFLAGQRLLMMQREHLGARSRSVRREVSVNASPGWPNVSAQNLTQSFVSSRTTPTGAFARSERASLLHRALEKLEAIDREVLWLRHFDELSNDEVALLLGITKAASSNRYVRALRRIRPFLSRADS